MLEMIARLFKGEPQDTESIPADWKPRGLNPEPHRQTIAKAMENTLNKGLNS